MKRAAPIEKPFACTLEDLYQGCTKKMKVTKTLMDASGQRTPVEKILTIEVKPGWKKGTKVTFEQEGDEAPGIIPADIIFVLDEKPHTRFKRENNDLIYTAEVTLADALQGTTVSIQQLDGRTLRLPVPEVITPDTVKTIANEGMPISKTNGTQKGNMKVKFHIKFPAHIPDAKRRQLGELLRGV
eukprot:GILJ01001114.1.p1 GENE.GILJ01001114.1~~GILJ01001114.1.p1  ORF type:complete len:201 (-),score=33.68 GILJ01001114.1:267-821(-)